MSDLEYSFTAFFGVLMLLVVLALCLCGLAFVCSEIRQLFRMCKETVAKWREERVKEHLIEQVRKGRAGI